MSGPLLQSRDREGETHLEVDAGPQPLPCFRVIDRDQEQASDVRPKVR